MSLFNELKRRNVFRVGIAYIVTAWLLLEVADVVLNIITAPQWVAQVIMLVLGLGFPMALIFAWAFEMTPDGLRKETDVDRSQTITHKTGRKLDFLIIGVLALALGYFVWESRFEETGSEPFSETPNTQSNDSSSREKGSDPNNETSIAVLPFVNMSADADNEFFSDGISEELLNVLVKVNTLRVASRTSAFAYKGKEIPMKQIARELSVGHILEGSVRKAGNTVRITAQLIDATTDTHLWSETYERELDDIFDIQEEISNAIVDALKLALNVEEVAAVERAQRPTDNAEAYELYLQGRHLWRARGTENIQNAISLFERAIELDPDFARAYEAQASAHNVLPFWSGMSLDDALNISKPFAEKALELNPALAEARANLAEYYGNKHQWANMIDSYETALKHEPRNATVLQWYGEGLSQLGYLSQALAEIKTAYALDPASPVINNVLAFQAINVGEYDLGIKHYAIAFRMGVKITVSLLFMHVQRGEYDLALELVRTNPPNPSYVEACINAFADPEKIPQLKSELKLALESESELYRSQDFRDHCNAFAGNFDAALDATIARVRDNWSSLLGLWRNHGFSSAYRQDQRFKDLFMDMGLVDFYRINGWPDYCRPLGDEDFECD